MKENVSLIEINELQLPEQARTSVYVMPPLERQDASAMKLLVLTDGNNRAYGNNSGYDEGGKKVVSIAEHLAERGDVSTMVACIMSKENCLKRGDDFFEALYRAFVALGLRINTKGVLKKSGIRLEVSGDLHELSNRSMVASDLAEMITRVCELTHCNDHPTMKLVLGVNYGQGIALEHQADIIYRSGMEESRCVRLSGLKTREGILHVGSETLWPKLTTNEIDEVLDNTKMQIDSGVARIGLGYSKKTIDEMVEVIESLAIGEDTEVTIPSLAEEWPSLDTTSSSMSDEEGVHNSMIRYRDELKSGTHEKSANGISRKIKLIPVSEIESLMNKRFSAFIAPGQQELNHVLLPERPSVNYATVHACDNDLEKIGNTIREAVTFNNQHQQLNGAERKQAQVAEKVTENEDDNHYFKYYAQFTQFLERYPHLKVHEISKQLTEEEKLLFASPEDYFIIMDLFVSKYIAYASKINAPMENQAKLNAYVNYVIVSYFIACIPEKINSNEDVTEIYESAEWLIKYVLIIYAGDESVFDLDYPEETKEQKFERIKQATEYLNQCIYADSIDQVALPQTKDAPTLLSFSREWEEFQNKYKKRCPANLLNGWRRSLAKIYNCWVNEHDPNVVDNAFIDRLQNGEDAKTIFYEIQDKYFHIAPSFVRLKITELFETTASSHEATLLNDEQLLELRNLLYLTDVHSSIGAGMVNRTLMVALTKEPFADELAKKFDDLCNLFDYAVRVANDLSDHLKRSSDDRDLKEDIYTISFRHYQKITSSRSEAVLLAVASVKMLYDTLQAEFDLRCQEIKAISPRLGEILERSNHQKNIYKQAHYRTANRQKMLTYV